MMLIAALHEYIQVIDFALRGLEVRAGKVGVVCNL